MLQSVLPKSGGEPEKVMGNVARAKHTEERQRSRQEKDRRIAELEITLTEVLRQFHKEHP